MRIIPPLATAQTKPSRVQQITGELPAFRVRAAGSTPGPAAEVGTGWTTTKLWRIRPRAV